MSEALIALDDLSVGIAGPGPARPVLRRVSMALGRGEAIGIVGESGSGKSTAALAMLGYLKPGLARLGGVVRMDGADLLAMPEARRRRLRGRRIALVPQNAGQALTPTLRVGAQIAEALALARREGSVEGLLDRVGLPDPGAIARRFPHELSGGQQQRIAIAMALAAEPEALVLDEPTTGLDVTTQARILDFLVTLPEGRGTALAYVSHDLGVIARVARRVFVLYAGEVVEEGPARALLSRPAHPYPQALLRAVPRLTSGAIPDPLPGIPPQPGALPRGCAFAPRCPIARPRCHEEAPPLAPVAHGRARCFYPFEAAERLPPPPPAPARAPRRAPNAPALAVADLAVRYGGPGLLDRLRGRGAPDVVSGVGFDLAEGGTLGLVGESGSGKSTILRAVAGLAPAHRGRIQALGRRLAPRVRARPRADLRALQTVFQNADQALNPRLTVREAILAPLRLYFDLPRAEAEARARALMAAVRLPEAHLDRLPAQLSGGERQRVGIARAFAAEPAIVLCDEVTSALDVSVQAAVLALLRRLQAWRGAAYVFVSHDLAVVRAVADRVAVLYRGRVMEMGSAEAIFAPPHHPYTAALLAAVLDPDPDAARPDIRPAEPRGLAPPDRGCPFQAACPRRIGPVCDEEAPPERRPAPGHAIRCHLPLDALGEGRGAQSASR